MSSLPGWNSVEATTKYHEVFEIAGIVLLALLVAAEAFAYVYGKRKDALIVEGTRVSDAQRVTEENAARERYTAEAAKITVQLSESEKKVSELQRQQMPRRLSEQQTQLLISALSRFGGQKVDVVCILGDVEGKQFAQDFDAVFRAAGWDDGGGTGINQAVITPDPVGIEVTLNESEARAGRIPVATEPLIDALIQADLLKQRKAFVNPQSPADRITFRVGRKP